MQRHKKGELNAGLITGLVMSIVSLVIAVTIGLIITSTLDSANLLEDDETTSLTITNESFNGVTQGCWLNATTYTLASANSSTSTFVITEVWNQTDAGEVVVAANYSVDAATGIIQNTTSYTFPNVTVSYTFVHLDANSDEENAVGNMTANLTEGIDNISEKLPTVLLIAAIVLILTVLSLLVGVWQRMRLSSSSI